MDPELAAFLTERFGEIGGRFDTVDRRLDGVDRRFVGVHRRFDATDRRIDKRFEEAKRFFGVVAERSTAPRVPRRTARS